MRPLLLGLLLAGAAGAAPLPFKPAAKTTLPALQRLLRSPQGAGLLAQRPALKLLLAPGVSPSAVDALEEGLPPNFAAFLAKEEPSAGELDYMAAAVLTAYDAAAPRVETQVRARVESLLEGFRKGDVSQAELAEALKGLAPHAAYGREVASLVSPLGGLGQAALEKAKKAAAAFLGLLRAEGNGLSLSEHGLSYDPLSDADLSEDNVAAALATLLPKGRYRVSREDDALVVYDDESGQPIFAVDRRAGVGETVSVHLGLPSQRQAFMDGLKSYGLMVFPYGGAGSFQVVARLNPRRP